MEKMEILWQSILDGQGNGGSFEGIDRHVMVRGRVILSVTNTLARK